MHFDAGAFQDRIRKCLLKVLYFYTKNILLTYLSTFSNFPELKAISCLSLSDYNHDVFAPL